MTTVTILSDNRVAESRPFAETNEFARLRGEWGFSAAVGNVLLDTGMTGVARENAVELGVDPAFETIVLSHGHEDHTGGLDYFLRNEPTVYLHPEAWRSRYRKDVHIGLPFVREKIEDAATVVEHREPIEVESGIWALGEIPREHPDNPSGVTPQDGELRTDHVPDDQSLAVETDGGIALILGCCHAGLRNTITYAESVLDDDVRAVVGGTHLVAQEQAEVVETAAWLDEKPALELVAPCHCTGFEAEATLREELPERFVSVGTGTILELESMTFAATSF